MGTILISGGGGYLGRHLVPKAAEKEKTNYTFFNNDPLNQPIGHRLDVRDREAVIDLVGRLSPRIIIHTVGSNRGDGLREVIVEGTNHVVEAAKIVGARLIHLSTDVVFNGQEAPYDETASPAPIHEYGRAKAEAEKIVGTHNDQVIIRTSLIYGLQIMDHGTAWMADALKKGQPVTLFTNQRRNPVWVQTLCRAILELAQNSFTGILNVAGSQELTRAQFGMRMLDWWQIKPRRTLKLAPGDSQQWPPDCTLNLALAGKILTTPLPGVDEVLSNHQKGEFFKEEKP